MGQRGPGQDRGKDVTEADGLPKAEGVGQERTDQRQAEVTCRMEGREAGSSLRKGRVVGPVWEVENLEKFGGTQVLGVCRSPQHQSPRERTQEEEQSAQEAGVFSPPLCSSVDEGAAMFLGIPCGPLSWPGGCGGQGFWVTYTISRLCAAPCSNPTTTAETKVQAGNNGEEGAESTPPIHCSQGCPGHPVMPRG